MDKKENAYLEMANRTLLICDQNTSFWDGNVVISKVVNTLRGLVASGNNLQKDKTGTDYTGLTSAKDEKFDEMTQKAFKLAKKLASFARIEGVREILPLVDYSISSLKDAPEKEVMRRCMVINEKARQYMGRLADYNVTLDEVESLDTAIAAYKDMPEDRNNVKSSKKIIGQDLAKAIKAIREQFVILDDVVEGLVDDESFQRKYFEARMIIDPASGRTSADPGTETK